MEKYESVVEVRDRLLSKLVAERLFHEVNGILDAHVINDADKQDFDKKKCAIQRIAELDQVDLLGWKSVTEGDAHYKDKVLIFCYYFIEFMESTEIGGIQDIERAKDVFIKRALWDYNLKEIGELQAKPVTKELIRQLSHRVRVHFVRFMREKLTELKGNDNEDDYRP
jgi:hypothetical protein